MALQTLETLFSFWQIKADWCRHAYCALTQCVFKKFQNPWTNLEKYHILNIKI